MRWLLPAALMVCPAAAYGQDMQERAFDDGTSSSSAGRTEEASRSSSDDREMSAKPAKPSVQVGKRLTQRINGRLDTRITSERLSRVRDGMLGRDEQAAESGNKRSTDPLTARESVDE